MSSKVEQLCAQLNERILVLDGGMGTMIQSYRLNEADFRGERFADWPCDLKGNGVYFSGRQRSGIPQHHF